MVLRILRQPGSIKISKPGIDVSTAAEKDLLISLGARNVQVIKRGFLAAPAPTNVDIAQGVGTFTFTVPFDAQATRPDVWPVTIFQPGAPQRNDMNAFVSFGPTMTTTFGLSSATVVVRGSNNAGIGLVGISFAVYRKRLDS